MSRNTVRQKLKNYSKDLSSVYYNQGTMSNSDYYELESDSFVSYVKSLSCLRKERKFPCLKC